MRGDFSHDTFDPRKHYTGVLLQQGRMLLDADWNEQGDILRHYMRRLARDVIGPHGGPADDLGFEIIVNESVLRGRLASMREGDTRKPKAAALPALHRAIESGGFVIAPGRYYVEGIGIENDTFIAYTDQPGYPLPGFPSLDQLKQHPYLVYLDVWERLVTYVEDAAIRDEALGGADTAVRSKVVWQARAFVPASDTPPDPSIITTFPQTGSGRLRARARFDYPSPNRYSGAENRLYRVEIHAGGTAAGGATFKWSRQNGAAVYPISNLSRRDPDHLVAELVSDAVRSVPLLRDDRVELTDDDYVLKNAADPLLVVTDLDETKGLVTLNDGAGRSTVGNEGKHLLLRRWDQRGQLNLGWASPVAQSSSQQTGSNWLLLEDGIQISFSATGEYRTGDYWLIPARTATSDIDWPQEKGDQCDPVLDGDANPIVTALLPRGPKHAYAPLAVCDVNKRLLDCRRELPQAHRISAKDKV